ncbi:hypothetical protein TWF481_002935 [Arthrobotrys musiformis]|uniref:Uncharacterized protein n=1 Tax=Arthrobotrys musiformis TaxID=47236 RepID=A0AAV9VRP5_9PEZI
MAEKVLLECLPDPVTGATVAGYAERVAVNAGYNADAPQYHGKPPEECAYYIKWIELNSTCGQLTTYELVRNFKETYHYVVAATPPKWVKIGHARAPPAAPPDDAPRDAKLLWLANVEGCYMDTIIADIPVAIYDPPVATRDVFTIDAPNWFKDICVGLTAAQLLEIDMGMQCNRFRIPGLSKTQNIDLALGLKRLCEREVSILKSVCVTTSRRRRGSNT